MRAERGFLATCVALMGALVCAAAGIALAQPPQAVPPPEGAGDQEVLEHLLAAELGHWTRVGGAETLEAPGPRPEAGGLWRDAQRYDLVAGGRAHYDAPGGSVGAEVAVLIMASRLDALGVFSARRPEKLTRLTMLSPSFWDGDVVEAYSDRIYMRVDLTVEHEATQALAQDLAMQVELRLPPRGRPPRLMRTLPRRWLDPFSMVYGAGELCGYDPGLPVLTGRYELGRDPMTVAVIELADADGARAHYTRLLEHAVSLGTPREVRQLAAEAFVCENTIWGACLGLWQDEFVAWGCTTGEVSEAEAIMRLVASEIRITRPLPHLDGGG